MEVPYDALQFPPDVGRPDVVVVPAREAKALVAYLKSLDRTFDVD